MSSMKKLTEEQLIRILTLFKTADNTRLLHAPDEETSQYLHGLMSGIREELKTREIEVEGVTGLWWYEELEEPKKQLTVDELVEKYGEDDPTIQVLIRGQIEGKRMVGVIMDESVD
jgi:hypothetical protein